VARALSPIDGCAHTHSVLEDLARQQGVITFDPAVRGGFSPDQVQSFLARCAA
jgi:DivIVA domain-containing protein